MISPRSRPAFTGSTSATPTSLTRGSSSAALATSWPIQPRPTIPMRMCSRSLPTAGETRRRPGMKQRRRYLPPYFEAAADPRGLDHNFGWPERSWEMSTAPSNNPERRGVEFEPAPLSRAWVAFCVASGSALFVGAAFFGLGELLLGVKRAVLEALLH